MKWWLCVGMLLVSGALRAQSDTDALARRGEQMFTGEQPLTGTIVGHDEPLPAFAAKCSNCHDANDPGKAGYGARLTRAALVEPAKRRGGPASSYEPGSFCRLLRTGVDPVHVVILRTMPRYQIDDEGCMALWDYLMARKN